MCQSIRNPLCMFPQLIHHANSLAHYRNAISDNPRPLINKAIARNSVMWNTITHNETHAFKHQSLWSSMNEEIVIVRTLSAKDSPELNTIISIERKREMSCLILGISTSSSPRDISQYSTYCANSSESLFALRRHLHRHCIHVWPHTWEISTIITLIITYRQYMAQVSD